MKEAPQMTANLKLVHWPDPLLSTPCLPVENFSGIPALANKMFGLLAGRGLGLAANQCGLVERMFVVQCEDVKLVMVNPSISSADGVCVVEEGCLSFPDQFTTISRPEKITVCYFTEKGEQWESTFKGMIARVIQHEIDHLNGVVFTAHVSRPVRKRIEKAMNK